MTEKNYAFFSHTACEYFPCHETKNRETFNCLFCYCPLYALGDQCGGNFHYLENGVKSCVDCKLPHTPAGYDYVLSMYPEIAKLAQENRRHLTDSTNSV